MRSSQFSRNPCRALSLRHVVAKDELSNGAKALARGRVHVSVDKGLGHDERRVAAQRVASCRDRISNGVSSVAIAVFPASPRARTMGKPRGSCGRALGIVCLQGLVIHGLFVSRRGSQGGATHLFAIPLLAAPATSVDVNQAGAGAAASGVLHGFLESLWLGMVQTLSLRTISGVEPGHKGRSCAGFSRRASGQTVAGSKRSRR